MRMVSKGSKEFEWDWAREVIELHQSSLIRYATSILKDGERAKDVVQETFIKLCRSDRSQVEEHLVPWLFRVTRNQALDVLRKEKRMSRYEQPEVVESLADVSVDTIRDREKREAIDTLLQLVRALPGKQREVVLLKFQQDLSYKEISEVTGMTVSNVGYVLHHALKKLKQRWKMVEAA